MGSWARLGESLAASFKRQDLSLLQNVPPAKSSFSLAACPLAHSMECCPSAAEHWWDSFGRDDPSAAQCRVGLPPASGLWLP